MYEVRKSQNVRNSTDTVLMETKLCEDIRTIRLRRNGTSPLGFAIRGGWEHGTGIFVSEVYSQSEAEREGLKPGDQILRVNGFSIEQAIHDEVISLIKSANKIILKVKSVGMIPVKENQAQSIQWKFISDLQNQTNNMDQQTTTTNSSTRSSNKKYRQQKSKSKCPIHSLKKEEGQIAKILLKNDNNKLIPSKASNSIELNSAGSSPTSSVSSKYSSSITSSSLSSCSKLIAKSCKSALSSNPSSHQPGTKGKLNGYYSRSLSNLTTSTDFVDGFSLTSTSTINFTRNKSTSNLNLELASSISPQQTPEQTASSTDDDSSTLEKVKSSKYATVYVTLSNRESLGCSVVKGPNTCPGIFIQTIKSNGVAAKAGLEVGDQIISLNDISCLPEHMQFSEAVEKIKSSKQMKFKVKKNTAISLFLEQNATSTTNKSNSRKLMKKPISTDLSSSSCNESTSPVEHVSSASTNYSRRSNKNHFNSCNSGHHLPYYMNKFSSRHNLNASSSSSNYLKGQSAFNQLSEKSSLSGSSKRSLRKNISHHRSYTSLLSNNSTYGQRMSGYHSPVCLRHSSSNYYSQSENDYSMYELEEQNENKKIDLIVNSDKLINGSNRAESYGYCKNGRQYRSKSIRNLSRTNAYECSCLTYYPGSDCNEFDYHKKKSTFNMPLNSNLLKQKLLCNNLSCSNLTFKSQTDIGLSNCQQLCTMLNNQMNALQLNHLTDDVKSKSSLELNEDLILNNKLYEKMRLEKERLAIERKKLETEQLRLQEEKDKFEREKKQMESIKQHDELKCISSSSTLSNTSATTSQTIQSTTTQSIGFLDEIKKLAERRVSENALITDTLNKTRFSTGELKPVRLLPIADGKIKQLHPDDEKRKQHDALMQEFREAHHKMFGSKIGHNLKPIVLSSACSNNVSNMSTANQQTSGVLEKLTDSQSNESNTTTEINSSSNLEQFTCSTNGITNLTASSVTTNLQSTTTTTTNQVIPIPPIPPSSIMTMTSTNLTLANTATVSTSSTITTNNTGNPNNNHQDNKFAKKLNTFGKLVQPPDQRNLPNNVLPKNNLNGLNHQGETVKILRTSTPSCKKGPAPQPPINKTSNSPTGESGNQKSTTRIIKMNKKEEKITFLNGVNNNLYIKQNQIKLEGQTNSSLVEQTKYTSDHLIEKPNYLTKTASDFSLSSLSIKVVQVPTK